MWMIHKNLGGGYFQSPQSRIRDHAVSHVYIAVFSMAPPQSGYKVKPVMSLRGRKPKHPGIEVLDGGRNKRRAPQSVEIPGGYPECPPEFEHPKVWKQLRVLFEENGTPIRSSDGFAIEDLCSMIAEVRSLREMLKTGRTTQGERNPEELRAHPAAAQLSQTRAALWRAFERFGLTPVDSARLPLKSKVKTPYERVMEGFTPPAG